MDANSSTISRACRLCLAVDGVKLPIFDEEGQKRQFALKIRSCLSLEADISDPLPHIICHKCVYKLDTLHDFRETSRKCDTFLRENLITTERPTSSLGLVPIVKTERDDGAVDYEPAAKRINTSEGNDNRYGQFYGERSAPYFPVGGDPASERSHQFAFVDVDQALPAESSTVCRVPPLYHWSSIKLKVGEIEEEDNSIQSIEYSDAESASPLEHETAGSRNQKESVLESDASRNDFEAKVEEKRSHGHVRDNTTNEEQCSPSAQSSECNKSKEPVNSKLLHRTSARNQFKCEFCRKTFKRKIELLNHNCNKVSVCHTCNKKVNTYFSFKIHIGEHNGTITYFCSKCKKSFHSVCTFKKHITNHKDVIIEPWQCCFCMKKYPTKYQMMSHILYLHEDKISLPMQEKQKKKTVSGESNRNTANKPQQQSSFQGQVTTKHSMKSNSEVNRSFCKECGEIFENEESLLSHKTYHEKSLASSETDVNALEKNSSSERDNASTTNTPYECKFCMMCFESEDSFQSHWALHLTEVVTLE